MTVFGPATLDQGHGSIWLRLVYTEPDHRSDFELASLASQGIDAHNSRYDLNAAVGLAYGVTHQLTVSLEVPYVRHKSIRFAERDGAIQNLGSAAGIGDMSLLAKYRVTRSESRSIAVIGGVKMPTGSTHVTDRSGDRFETEHQPGAGSWDAIFGASAGTKAGPVSFAASGIYQLAGQGAQRTRLGDRLQGGIAVSHRFGPTDEEHDNHHDDSEEHHEHTSSWDVFAELAGEWEGHQRIRGSVEQDSGGKWAWVAPGVTFNSASGWSATAAFGIPVWQRIRASHPENAYRFALSLSHGF